MDIFSIYVKEQILRICDVLTAEYEARHAMAGFLFSRCVISHIMIQTMCYLSPAVWDKEEGRKGSRGPGCTGS